MELTDLKTFMAVVDQGGITRASETLNRVPSSITTRISQLEDMLDVRLFFREGKRLLITPEGQTLYNYAKRITRLAAEAEKQVRSKEPGGKLRIGAMGSTAAMRLARPLSAMHAEYPEVELELGTGSSEFLYEALMANRFDAVFVSDAPTDKRIERVPAFDEELVLIAASGHPAISEADDIRCATILAFKEGCYYRKRLLSWFKIYGREPERIIELDSYHVILGGVAAGMGIAIVPRRIIALSSDESTISIHTLGKPFGRALTELVWRTGSMSANISALRKCVGI